MAGIGAIAMGVEKTKEAISHFAESNLGSELAKKGEKAYQAAVDKGNQEVEKVKGAFIEVTKPETAARKTPARKAPVKKTTATKTSAKTTPAKTPATRKVPARKNRGG